MNSGKFRWTQVISGKFRWTQVTSGELRCSSVASDTNLLLTLTDRQTVSCTSLCCEALWGRWTPWLRTSPAGTDWCSWRRTKTHQFRRTSRTHLLPNHAAAAASKERLISHQASFLTGVVISLVSISYWWFKKGWNDWQHNTTARFPHPITSIH